MINRNALKGAMVTAGYPTLESASRAVGIKPSTMYRKMREGRFDNFEIQAMIEEFHIEDIKTVFFS